MARSFMRQIHMVIVTRHAKKRLKERNGLNVRSVNRIAERAYMYGPSIQETSGRLNKWLTSITFKNKDVKNIHIYGDKVYLFRDNILVTVLQIPSNLTRQMKNMIKTCDAPMQNTNADKISLSN